MWRSFARGLLVWLSLFGLIPAALACAQTMVNRDCCPPGQEMPCDEQGPGNVEQAACCATPSLAPSAVHVASAQDEFDAPVLVPVMAPGLPAPRAVVRACSLQPTGPPLDLCLDYSLTYLTTARLRL